MPRAEALGVFSWASASPAEPLQPVARRESHRCRSSGLLNLTMEESRGQQTLAFERVKYGKVQHESQQTPASGDHELA